MKGMPMVPASSDDVKSELLRMLEAFDSYCSAKGLDYSLLAGTLLGAIRHKGFIPWDDDVDVCMPRQDYDRLIGDPQGFLDLTGFSLAGHLGVSIQKSPLAKVASPNIWVAPEREVASCPLWIDVNPVDGLPDDPDEMAELYRGTHGLRAAMNLLGSTPGSGRTAARRAIKRLAGPLRHSRGVKTLVSARLTSVSRRIPYGSTRHVGIVSWGLAEERECNPYEGFAKKVDVEFEGRTFKAMSCWDDYLTRIYGSQYMDMPPAEKRYGHLAGAWFTHGVLGAKGEGEGTRA